MKKHVIKMITIMIVMFIMFLTKESNAQPWIPLDGVNNLREDGYIVVNWPERGLMYLPTWNIPSGIPDDFPGGTGDSEDALRSAGIYCLQSGQAINGHYAAVGQVNINEGNPADGSTTSNIGTDRKKSARE